MKSILVPAAALLALYPAFPAGTIQADPQTTDRIIDIGKNHSQVMDFERGICLGLGARLTGSPELAKGYTWALDQFKKMGCTNVHLEKWGDIPVGFDRGPTQVARMVEPYDEPIVFTTPAWTNGTNGVVTAEAMYAPLTMKALNDERDALKGKWVVMPQAPRPGSRVQAIGPEFDDVRPELEKMPIAGEITGSRNELVVTFGRYTGKTFEHHPGVPQIIVRKSDYDRIARNLDFKRKVVLQIGAENRWFKGPVPAYNVVAEIKGTEEPDEAVIVSGHFDSWNGPGSQGASDNGVGSAVTLEAARILCQAHAKPKRTIRFILWSGEEQGIYGSTAYVKQHARDLAKISAVLVDDGGSNYQGGYVIIASQKPMFQAAIAPMLKGFPDYPQILHVVDAMPRNGGSDQDSFNAVGVPGFFTIETGRQDYTFVHHTQNDTIQNVIPEYLVQSATNHAAVSYSLACAPTLLPRAPQPVKRTGG